MGRQVEIGFKFSGSDAELKKIVDGLKGVKDQAGVTDVSVKKHNDSVKDLGKYSVNSAKEIERLRAQLSGMQSDGGKASKEIRELREQISKVAEGGHGFEGFHEKIRANLEDPFRSANVQITEYLDKLGAGGAIAAGVGVGMGILATKMFELVESQAQASRETSNMATRLGISADTMDKLQAAAKIAGVEIGSIEGASRLLAAALQEDASASNKTVAALKSMGVNIVDVTGKQREMGEVVVEVLGKLGKIENTAQRVALAQQTLGRASKEFLPLIMNYDKLMQTVTALGVAYDDADEKLKGAAEQISEAEIAWDEMKKSLAAKIAPIVIPIIRVVTEVASGKRVTFGSLDERLTDLTALSSGDPNDAKALELPDKRPAVPGGLDEVQKQDVAAGDRKASAFKNRSSDLDEEKKQLEELKKKANDLRGSIELGGQGAAAIGGKVADYDKLTAQAKQLEATIKAQEKFPELLKKLQDDEQAINDGALSGVGRTMEEFKRKDQEMLDGLGAAFTDRVTKLFGSQRFNELQKLIQEGQKKLSETVAHDVPAVMRAAFTGSQDDIEAAQKQLNEDPTKHKNDEQFRDELRKDGEEAKKTLAPLEQIVKAYDDVEKARASAAVESTIKQVTIAGSGGDQVAVANKVAAIRLGAAAQEFDLEQKRHDLTLATQHTQEEAGQAEIELVKARGKYEEDVDKARMDRENTLMELRKQNLEEYKQGADALFNDIISRNAGGKWNAGNMLEKTFTDLGKSQLKTVFSNAITPLVQSGATMLSAGGGAMGAGQGALGSLLKGTLFDPKNAAANTGVALTSNTDALHQVKVSLDTLTSTLTGTDYGSGTVVSPSGSSGLIGSVATLTGVNPSTGAALAASGVVGPIGASAISLDNLPLESPDAAASAANVFSAAAADASGSVDVPTFKSLVTASAPGGASFLTQLIQGAASVIPKTTNNGPLTVSGGIDPATGQPTWSQSGGTSTTGGLFAGLVNPVNPDGSQMSTAQVIGNTAASAGAVFGAVKGVEAGVKQGGAKGGAEDVSSVLGLAATIPGPQQPFVAAGALLASAISAFLPDPRTLRANQQAIELQNATYYAPNPINETIDSGGRLVSTDTRGQNRILDATPSLSFYNQPVGFSADANHQNRLVTTLAQQLGYDWNGAPPSAPVISGAASAGSSSSAPAPVIQVVAMDTQDFVRRSNDIAGALTVALQNGHRVRTDIARVVNPL